MDYGHHLDFFDDYFTVLPPQTLETTFIPHDTAVSSQSSSNCLNELFSIPNAPSYPENTTCMLSDCPSDLSDGLQCSTSNELEILPHRHSHRKIMSENKNTKGLGSNATREEDILPEQPNWMHISSTELKPHEAIKDLKQKRKAGRRHGRLKPETAKHAREMRHLRACLPCVIMKMSVSWSRNIGIMLD
jgi:hypothetical protein